MRAIRGRVRGRRRIAVAAAALAALLAAAVAVLLAGGHDAPPDRAAALVPADALAYVDLAADPRGEQSARAAGLVRRLPVARRLRELVLARASAAGGGLRLGPEVRAWLGDEAAFAVLRESPGRPAPLLLLRVADEPAARRFLDRLGGGAARTRRRGVSVRDRATFSTALHGGFALLGAPAAVRRAIDAGSGAAPALAGVAAYRHVVERLPADRLAHAYLAGPDARARLGAATADLLRVTGVPPLRAAALSVTVEEGRVRLGLRGLAAPLPAGVSGGPCIDEPRDELALPDRAPSGVSGYLGFARFECAVATLLARPDSRAGRAVARFLDAARAGGVELGPDILPLSRGEGALFLARGRDRPAATLVVDGIPRQRALDLMGRLQPALLRLTRPLELGTAPAFSARPIEGIPVVTATLGPQLELSYAAFDGKLAVSTSVEGVLGARRGGGLEGREDVEQVLEERPERASSLVFLALDQLLALGDRVGLAADPGFRAVRDALRGLPAVGASVSREGDDTTAELSFLTP